MTVNITDSIPDDAAINPATIDYDKSTTSIEGVSTEITWNHPSSVIEVLNYATGVPIGSENWTVEGSLLKIKKDYLLTLTDNQSYTFSIQFNSGNPALLTVNIYEVIVPLEDVEIYNNGNIYGVGNNPTMLTQFTTSQAYRLTFIANYHWNYGSGQTPGTIWLEDDKGITYGPWQATGSDGMGGVPNANWNITLETLGNQIIPPGTFTVHDSDVSTWSQNYGSGFTNIRGIAIPETQVTTVTKTISNPSTSGFSLVLNPAVQGLISSDFILLDGTTPVEITNSPATTDGGATYTVAVSLEAGKPYTVNITKAGYDFGADSDVVVVEAGVHFSASPLVQIGINPNYGDSAGIFVGLQDIRDAQGNLISDANLAGYHIEVYYDHSQVTVLDLVDEAQLGNFTFNDREGTTKASVVDVVYNGTSNFEKLFFVPIALTGTSSNSTNVTIKFISLSDLNLNQIMIPDVTLTFQRGKIVNEASNKSLSIADAIAGLQYLAKLRDIGVNLGKVNVINMASILPPDSGVTIIKPRVQDVIALMQKLVGLRDDSFQLVTQ